MSVTTEGHPGPESGLYAKLVRSIRRRGAWKTLTKAVRDPLYLYHEYRERRFDRVHGTDTRRMFELEDYDPECPNLEEASAYEAVTERYFRRMMGALPIRHEEFVFVDVGSGKGRALMLAAAYPFRRIVGVEMNPDLHAIAGRNVAAYRAATGAPDNFELLCMSSDEYALPSGDVVLFLYNPFRGGVMERLVASLRDVVDGGHRLYVLYRTPRCADLFDRQDFLRPLAVDAAYRVYEGR